MIARCEKECRDGGIETDMTEYRCVRLCRKRYDMIQYDTDCLHGLLPGPFFLSYSVFVFIFFLIFSFLCCALD